MSRRIELLLVGLVASMQLLLAWLFYSHEFVHEAPPPAAAHLAAPAAPIVAGLGGSQSSKRHF